MLVEIARINKDVRDPELPNRLSDAVKEACSSRIDAEELGRAVWTIFDELIQNIFDHSGTQLDGYAALQVYQGGHKVSVAVLTAGTASWTRYARLCKRSSPNWLTFRTRKFSLKFFAKAYHATVPIGAAD